MTGYVQIHYNHQVIMNNWSFPSNRSIIYETNQLTHDMIIISKCKFNLNFDLVTWEKKTKNNLPIYFSQELNSVHFLSFSIFPSNQLHRKMCKNHIRIWYSTEFKNLNLRGCSKIFNGFVDSRFLWIKWGCFHIDYQMDFYYPGKLVVSFEKLKESEIFHFISIKQMMIIFVVILHHED